MDLHRMYAYYMLSMIALSLLSVRYPHSQISYKIFKEDTGFAIVLCRWASREKRKDRDTNLKRRRYLEDNFPIVDSSFQRRGLGCVETLVYSIASIFHVYPDSFMKMSAKNVLWRSSNLLTVSPCCSQTLHLVRCLDQKVAISNMTFVHLNT